MYKVGELSKATGVKEGTIRFYEKCGFLEMVERLPNHYRGMRLMKRMAEYFHEMEEAVRILNIIG